MIYKENGIMYCSKAEERFKIGDIIMVQPPDRISKSGYEAEILEIDSSHCKYKLLEDNSEFDVDFLILKN